MKADLIIKNGNIYSNGEFFKGGIAIKSGKIVAIADDNNLPDAEKFIDAGGHMVLPGVIDTHVHVRDPGHRERGTFVTETKAAAAGGVTCIMEHPISSPPPYSPEVLENRIKVAAPQALVDYTFFGAAGSEYPQEIGKIADMGIVAYKTFLHEAPEGRDDEFRGLTMADDGAIMDGFKAVSQTGLILTVHAENNDMIQRLIKQFRAEGKVGFEYHYKSRPPISEYETVAKILMFAKETGVRVSFAHISTPEAAEMITQAKKEGQDVYLETCPHYLFLTEAAIDKYGPYAKGNPPVRSEDSRKKLWNYVQDGSVDFIGSDHSPFLVSEKEKGMKDIFTSAAGPACIEMTLPLMLTAVRDGKLTIKRMVELLSENAAKTFGLWPRKGILQVGSDADIIIVDVNNEFVVDNKNFVTKSRDTSPMYNGFNLIGKPLYTIVRGRIIMDNRQIDNNSEGWGQMIKPDWRK